MKFINLIFVIKKEVLSINRLFDYDIINLYN